MKSLLTLSLLPLAATATNILLPLYLYPSAVWNDNASHWQSLLTTLRAHRSVSFDVIINPDSGPGGPGFGRDDVNYVAGATLLKAEPNVRTLGYVHTDYGRLPAAAVAANVSAWAAWPAAAAPRGVFFDETPNGNPWNTDEPGYMRRLADNARAAGAVGGFLVFNAGQKVVDANVPTYFDAADQVVVFEEAWPVYRTVDPVANNLPAGRANKSAIIVHTFTGDLVDLGAELDRISNANIGGVWFTTTDYNQYTAPPANAENQANLLS
ncbi:hypothetical protein GGTG_07117 [Gaeumannomyces tritici R3-111a-1]|uniref:Spherulation-specific family 4 n=1 Tax=Gaeumannomyces tritici (strain R3-111a-1) TaxID=644352 RepID=J3P0S2_GAET3|nr:hypothetical protein GGTG_07117 [Gaeumannomyces tritici R3-111a-1]EJT77205.1 hypothetical protein GGTG_07117 [Gaeumannomyces tritici R3-111a-1]